MTDYATLIARAEEEFDSHELGGQLVAALAALTAERDEVDELVVQMRKRAEKAERELAQVREETHRLRIDAALREAALAAETERCAKVCDDLLDQQVGDVMDGSEFAAAIRATAARTSESLK